MFNELDTDRNGKISLDELKAKLEEMHAVRITIELLDELLVERVRKCFKHWSLIEIQRQQQHPVGKNGEMDCEE
ncbi:hypothetical protein X801_06941, partial [Opisthorchis viverrini]